MQESPSPEFLALVRQFLTHADPTVELADDTDLAAQGLDSLDSIRLLIGLEEAYGTRFKNEDVTPDIFRSPLLLWQAVARASACEDTG
jgi:acyl carrier protein